MTRMRLRGWVQNFRAYATKYFLDFRTLDATICQVISTPGNFCDAGKKLGVMVCGPCRELYLDIVVKEVRDLRSKSGIEYHITEFNKIIKPAELPPFEIGAKNCGTRTEIRAKNRTFDLRTQKNHAIFTIVSELQFAIANHFRSQGYLQINTPKILGSGSEGGTEVFKLRYYNKLAFLAQSPQLHKQMVVSAGFKKIFEINYMYRAEKSRTIKHLAEILAVDIEGAYDSTMDIIMAAQKMLIEISKFMAKSSAVKWAEKVLNKESKILSEKDFKIVTYLECMKILGYTQPVDFSIEDQRALGTHFGKDCRYYFVIDFPIELKPFYIGRKNNLSLGFDLYDTDRELSSGGMRETNMAQLKKNMTEAGINPDNFIHYLSAFKYAPPPHGGCCCNS